MGAAQSYCTVTAAFHFQNRVLTAYSHASLTYNIRNMLLIFFEINNSITPRNTIYRRVDWEVSCDFDCITGAQMYTYFHLHDRAPMWLGNTLVLMLH